MENILLEILPKDFNTFIFMASSWQNSETEEVAENIVYIQKELNPDAWSPFTWEQYQYLSIRNTSPDDKIVLDALVKGGKPTTITSCCLSAGYLTKNDSEQYVITEKFLSVIKKFKK